MPKYSPCGYMCNGYILVAQTLLSVPLHNAGKNDQHGNSAPQENT
jgi:hypothetical protein